ncbi:MAG: alanine racemase [Balneolaceae bacterium]|nr:alanine racemase [Balneolaceae bacterium]
MKIHFPNSTAEIDLSTITKNLSSIKERSGGKKILAVVKCDAYSHNAVKVSSYIENRVDYLAVANVDEGIELRMGGIKKPILILGVPTYNNAAAYQTHNLTATISHQTHFSILMDGTFYHINFDTGMGRLGFKPNQAEEVRQLAVANQRLTCTGIYSHYATSDDPGSEFVKTQHDRFKKILEHFKEVPLVHMSNTGAVANYRELDHFDMIRTGLGMLGYNPGVTRHDWLIPALTWRSTIAQVRSIKKGEVVSYSSTWRCPEDGFLATLPVGYGDGVPRSLSNKLRVRIGDNMYPQVGNVTMDYIMVYLGQDQITTDQEAILMGKNSWTAHDWADKGNTNVHEIMTNIQERVQREFINV